MTRRDRACLWLAAVSLCVLWPLGSARAEVNKPDPDSGDPGGVDKHLPTKKTPIVLDAASRGPGARLAARRVSVVRLDEPAPAAWERYGWLLRWRGLP